MDLGTRTSLAMLIRRFLAREITNQRYDDTALALLSYYPDAGAEDVYKFFWHSYCDIGTHYADKITPEARRAVARCLLFLYSGSPALPNVSIGTSIFTRWLTGRPALPELPNVLNTDSHWPFSSEQDFKATLARPPFLTGARRAG